MSLAVRVYMPVDQLGALAAILCVPNNSVSEFRFQLSEERMDKTVEVTHRGQITIPKNMRDRLGIEEGKKYRMRALEGGILVLTPHQGEAISALSGPNDPIIKPRGATKLDWEVELGVVIGSECRYVDEAVARSAIAGYCVCNDVSERAFQLERGGQWDKGKGCDSFGPVGPWLVTADEAGDPTDLGMWLEVNGRRFQSGSKRTMIFKPVFLVSYLSQFMSLQPGDIISTGTPPGVGMGQKPPIYLNVGDKVALGIKGLGEQRQIVVAAQ